MAIFVNYYPCSYGDSLVSMFQGLNTTRSNKLVFLNSSKRVWFKLLDFYHATAEQQQSLLATLNQNAIISCHRQYQFDFGKHHSVISIELDEFHWIGRRFCDVHINQLGKTLYNKKLTKFQTKVCIEDLVVHDYKQWAKSNILDTDIKMPFSLVYRPEELEKFCAAHNLKFSQKKIDEIIENIVQYK